jgi:hypothetical protein
MTNRTRQNDRAWWAFATATLAAGLLAFVAIASMAAAATDPPMKIELDARKADVAVKTPRPLKSRVAYIATVQGTFAYYGYTSWTTSAPCGPAAHPMFPSPGIKNSLVGTDAEFIFAVPGNDKKCDKVPVTFASFVSSTGIGFAHRTPIGAPTQPSKKHRYRYFLHGRGKRASFRLLDGYRLDNFGVLRITVARAPKGYRPPVPPTTTTPTTPTTTTPAP